MTISVGKVETESSNNVDSLESKNRRFSYSEVQIMTKSFERVLGKGGFGMVYHGRLDGMEVAVKILSQSSAQGFQQYEAEVKLLMRVHHRNLVSLVGYCDEGDKLALIYEYMANGNLQEHLTDSSTSILSWEGRLRIAVESAQAEGNTHVSTVVAGTPGYLDPQYYVSNRLTEKSDVYSFGVVLLEIITSKSAIARINEREKTHLSQWVNSLLTQGDIRNIVDPRLQGNFDVNSVWKAVEVAMACLSPAGNRRPTMNVVVMELNKCLATEIARSNESGSGLDTNNSIKHMLSMNLGEEPKPRAR
ncbi:hypothetical protein JRO89_XS09G0197500 [Xanthoceras sorbifolium]|uniref:Protein kinase domain-containing protein n=1 Tax=Xanthoceras sorbifolium TaxID=99658 RepID=A0ABQ8HLY8_9ROSI|nr:hypothetical protein JRO89_XS09G0197500 [Xanthoceras sorbifolium]